MDINPFLFCAGFEIQNDDLAFVSFSCNKMCCLFPKVIFVVLDRRSCLMFVGEVWSVCFSCACRLLRYTNAALEGLGQSLSHGEAAELGGSQQ